MAIDNGGAPARDIIYGASATGLYQLGTTSGVVTGASLGAITGSATFTAIKELGVDGGGNLYVADGSGNVTEVSSPTSAPAATTVATGASGYPGVAVGAQGCVYWGQNISTNYTIQVQGAVNFRGQAMGVTSGAIRLTFAYSGFTGTRPTPFIYDGGGNDYAISADSCNVSLTGAGTCTVSVTFDPSDRFGLRRGALGLLSSSTAGAFLRGYGLGSGLVSPTAITLDPSGNLFIADSGANSGAGAIYQIPGGGGTQTTLATGTGATMGGAITALSTDADGDLLATGPNGVIAFDPSDGNANALVTGNATGLAMGGNGLLTFATSGAASLSQVNLAQAPAALANFGLVQALSALAPAPLKIANIGNLPLTFYANPSVTTGEFSASTSTCGSAQTVAAGNTCNANVVFKPTAATTWSDALSFSDNSLNAANGPSAAVSVTLNGTGTAIPQTIAYPNGTPVAYNAAPITLTGTATSTSSNPIIYSLVSGPGSVTGSSLTLTGAGTVKLQASQAATTLTPPPPRSRASSPSIGRR